MLTPSACSLSGFSGLIMLVEVTDRLDTGYRSGVARYDGLITIGRNQIYDSSFTWEDPKKKRWHLWDQRLQSAQQRFLNHTGAEESYILHVIERGRTGKMSDKSIPEVDLQFSRRDAQNLTCAAVC